MNKPPVAVVSPKFQEIFLPTSSTVIDGSRECRSFDTGFPFPCYAPKRITNMFYLEESTDDDKVVLWHWEEVKGPLREEKVSADTAVLTLTSLVPGSYTFR